MNSKFPKEITYNYKIVNSLGRGGFGSVYLVEDLKTGQKKALKVLEQNYGNREVLQRFRMEYLGLKKYGTPYSVRVEDFIEATEGDGFYAVVMEYLPYGLFEWLETHPDNLVRINKEIIQAVYSFHSNTIAHRDLKPENLRIRENGRPVLIDFGLAFWSQDSLTRLTQEAQPRFMGTVLYMPPEVLFLSPQYQHHSEFREASLRLNRLSEKYPDIRRRGIAQRMLHDVFSLGMILLILNNSALRERVQKYPQQLAESYLKSPSAFIESYLSQIDSPIRTVIQSALRIFPDQRTENAGSLLELFQQEIPLELGTRMGSQQVLTSPLHEQQIFCAECNHAVVLNRQDVYKARFCPFCRAQLHHRFVLSSYEPVEIRRIGFRSSTLGLVWELPVHQEETIELRLGRANDNDVVFQDRSVSRQHAKMRIEPSGVKFINLQPRNPTLINDEVVAPNQTIRLGGQDTIQIGLLSYLNYDLIFKKQEN